jgi:hypothetical protein
VPGRWKRPGIQSGDLQQVTTHSKLVLTCHDRSPLSSPACRRAWIFMARRPFVNGPVSDAGQCSGSAGTATADIAIAVPRAGQKPGAVSGAGPTAATSVARKDGSIIATASGSTGGESAA